MSNAWNLRTSEKRQARRTTRQGGRVTVIGLRSVIPTDSEFCFQLHKAAMGDYVAAIWGWDEEDQRAHHAREFDPDHWQIITADRADVGMLSVEYRPTEIYLARIEVHPSYQGCGIGTHFITKLLHQADHQGRDLTLDVLSVNHRAYAFYQRHGLREAARHGDNNIRIRMRYTQFARFRPPPEDK